MTVEPSRFWLLTLNDNLCHLVLCVYDHWPDIVFYSHPLPQFMMQCTFWIATNLIAVDDAMYFLKGDELYILIGHTVSIKTIQLKCHWYEIGTICIIFKLIRHSKEMFLASNSCYLILSIHCRSQWIYISFNIITVV